MRPGRTALALGGLALLAAGVALCAGGVAALQAGREYAGSPVCAGSVGTECRVIETATVASVTAAGAPRRIDVGVRAGTSQLTAQLSPGYLAGELPRPGDRVQIEVWRGEVTKLELPGRGLVRTYAPSFDPVLLVAGLIASAAGLVLGVSSWPPRAKVAP